MKKIIILGLLFLSCEKDNPQPIETEDCNCDRVVSVNSFNQPNGTEYGHYVTVNDCTNFQQNHEYTGSQFKPNVGDCK